MPFSRFIGLRHLVESRERWLVIDDEWSYFETHWGCKSWPRKRRVILVRRRRPVSRARSTC
jgi:hypothetical protein